MKNAKRITKKILSALIALVMVLSAVPMNATAADSLKADVLPEKTLKFAALSDIHYYPKELTGNYCEAFLDSYKTSIGREPYESEGLLNSALAALEAHAKENGMEYVVVSGDLTAYSEYVAHEKFAERMEQFEKETGLKVLVTCGNHDINRPDKAKTYENGYEEPTKAITPEEFLEVYENLGYDLAYHKYVPTSGKGNMLSYSVRDDGYRIIMMDVSKYSSDMTDDGVDIAETAGAFSEEFLDWVFAEIADAKSKNETVIGVTHHNLVPHMANEYKIVRGFNVDGWEELSEQFADAGMHFTITGHIHVNDIAQAVSDDGETLTEISMSSLTSFPNYFREFEVTTDGAGKVNFNVESFDVDCVLPVTVNGTTYKQPFRVESIKLSYFDERGFEGLATDIIGGYIEKFAPIFAEKGVLPALADMGLDLEELLGGLLGDGIKLGPIDIFTTANIMAFLEDFLGQIQELYLTDPQATSEYILESLSKLFNIQLSEIPNSAFYDEYGIGSKTEPGTLGDAVMNTILYAYEGSLDLNRDAFMLDAINNLENSDVAGEIFDTLLEILADDILQEQLLNDVELRVDTLFPFGKFGHLLGKGVDAVFEVIFFGDTTILNMANKVISLIHKLGVVEFDSLIGILDHYMEEYITPSMLDGIGDSLARIIYDFAADYNFPDDYNATIVYDGKVPVEATRENYRLPTAVTTTFGEDQYSRNISWYTKSSVQGTDIQIVEYADSVSFTDELPDGITFTAETKRENRSYPGIDFGVIGLMHYEIPMNRHTITVSGLEEGKKYAFRVGDASRGWWSETGMFTVADGSDTTTFIHVTDPQSQSAHQYETFAAVIDKAYEMYPEAAFTVNTGDLVDHGDNFNQWQWLLDGSSETLMDTVMMPVAGNHEGHGTNATITNYTISNAPEQDFTAGVYYSFDYNNVHVAVLNANNLNEDEGFSDDQIEWLKEDMNASDADWKFVATHKAVYSNGSHYDDDDVIAMREQLSVLMPELDIDMVFQGHDHVYLRTDSMIDNKVEGVETSTTTFNGKEYTVKENPQGSVYVIGGCSGVKVYKQKDPALTDELFPRAEAIRDVEYSVFSGIRIVGDTLYFDAYEVNPETGETECIDSFAIRKNLSKEVEVEDEGFFKTLFNKVIGFVTNIFDKIFFFI
ncbi:MAG: metallophosphoesterase [Clostridia bacterium]|nr:metallophosphoesterase [Clostridia bacterium]